MRGETVEKTRKKKLVLRSLYDKIGGAERLQASSPPVGTPRGENFSVRAEGCRQDVIAVSLERGERGEVFGSVPESNRAVVGRRRHERARWMSAPPLLLPLLLHLLSLMMLLRVRATRGTRRGESSLVEGCSRHRHGPHPRRVALEDSHAPHPRPRAHFPAATVRQLPYPRDSIHPRAGEGWESIVAHRLYYSFWRNGVAVDVGPRAVSARRITSCSTSYIPSEVD